MAASHTADFDGKVNTIHASVVGMSGAISVHDVNSRVQAAIANAARLETYDLAVLARNVSRKNRYSNSAFQVEAGSGGIFDGAAASGTSTVRHETDVLLGKDAHVDVVGSWEDPGRTDFTAINEVLANEAVRLDSGGAISVALATSKLRRGFDRPDCDGQRGQASDGWRPQHGRKDQCNTVRQRQRQDLRPLRGGFGTIGFRGRGD